MGNFNSSTSSTSGFHSKFTGTYDATNINFAYSQFQSQTMSNVVLVGVLVQQLGFNRLIKAVFGVHFNHFAVLLKLPHEDDPNGTVYELGKRQTGLYFEEYEPEGLDSVAVCPEQIVFSASALDDFLNIQKSIEFSIWSKNCKSFVHDFLIQVANHDYMPFDDLCTIIERDYVLHFGNQLLIEAVDS